jgi:hypothetical protein
VVRRTIPHGRQELTTLQRLIQRAHAKRELLDRIGEAHDRGDMEQVERLWAEVEALSEQD